MNELVLASAGNGHRPPVVSVVLKKRHAVRGIRLINRDSLITYLASLVPGADGANVDSDHESEFVIEVAGRNSRNGGAQ